MLSAKQVSFGFENFEKERESLARKTRLNKYTIRSTLLDAKHASSFIENLLMVVVRSTLLSRSPEKSGGTLR